MAAHDVCGLEDMGHFLRMQSTKDQPNCWCSHEFFSFTIKPPSWSSTKSLVNFLCAPMSINMSQYLCIKMDWHFALTQHHCSIITLGFFFLGHFVHQACCHILHTHLLHGHSLYSVEQILYKGGKLSNKIMTTSSFLTGASRQAS